MAKSKKQKFPWFKSTVVTLLISFGIFSAGLLLMLIYWSEAKMGPFKELLKTIFSYGAGMTATALMVMVVAKTRGLSGKKIKEIIK